MTATATEGVTEGVIEGLPMTEYLALPQMSASRLEIFRRSPLQYRHALSAPPREETPALRIGTALHLAMLEPERFAGRYHVLGQCEGHKRNGDRCSYAGSVYRDGGSYCRTHDPHKGGAPDPDVITIGEGEMDAVLGMRDAIRAHPRAASLFEGRGSREETVVWTDADSGVECRMRLDLYVERAAMLADLKTSRDASPEHFGRDAERLGYWRKMAFYRRGLRAIGRDVNNVAVLAIESAAPHDLAPYLLDDAHLAAADEEVGQLLRRFADCVERDEWPGYSTEFALLYRPRWALGTYTEED